MIFKQRSVGASIYAALAENNFSVEELKTALSKMEVDCPDMFHLPGADFSTGSLGMDCQQEWEMAYGKKDRKDHKVYVVLWRWRM